MRWNWMNRFALLLIMAVAAGFSSARAASYAKADADSQLFSTPSRIRIEVPEEGMKVLREYVQVWRQTRPERIDVRATVREGGKVYTNVAVHLKGSYSFQPIDEKPSLTLNFDKFAPGQKFHGHTKIHLNNSVQDPSYLSEQLARELFRSVGVPAPRAGQALVSINGRELGLCVLIEGANKQWVKRNFASTKGNLYDGGSGGEITRALEADSGENRDDRTDLTNLVKAAREPDPQKRLARLTELLDMEEFITFAAAEAFLGHWDGYAIGGNNYRLFHDTSRGKMIFIPGGLDQLFVVSSAPNYSISPVFKGLVAKNLFNIPEGRRRYLQRIESLSTNEFRVAALHARVDRLAAQALMGLKDHPAARQQIEQGAAYLKARISSRAQFVARQVAAPPRPVQLAGAGELRLANWSYKGGTILPAASSRLMQGDRQILRVTGRGPGSTGAWRSTVLLGEGLYEFTGLARTEGVAAQPGVTNGVILRMSGERSAEGITISEEWKTLRYEFEVQGVEDVELICEFRGAQGMGWFDVNSLRLRRLEASAKPK
jgi:hypothetical protein